MVKIRLQLFLARSGLCSRRKAEILIREGKIKVNNKVVSIPYYKVSIDKDTVTFGNKRLFLKNKVYIVFNKPKGIICTKKDPYAKKKIFDLLPEKYKHLHPVGRLDKDSRGLLLLTNDGEFTFRITHPKFGVKKTYQVLLDRPIDRETLERIKKGVRLEDGFSLPCKIEQYSSCKLQITIREGRKRQIRRMFSALGFCVIDLVRIKEDGLSLGNLAPGRYRLLTNLEIRKLLKK